MSSRSDKSISQRYSKLSNSAIKSNYDLAKFVEYTKGKSPEETRDEILALIEREPNQA